MTLVAFDFDGTLSDSEMTVLLGDQNGTAEDMAAITDRAMNDEIDYATSLRERAALLDGLPEEAAERAYARVELRPDAAPLVSALRAAGHHVAILTGGFERGVQRALEREGISVDTIVANRLPIDEAESEAAASDASGPRPRALTGEVEGPLVEGTKDDALSDLAGSLDVPMDDTIAVGDGANDLPMLEVAGLAVGYDPKSAVEPACDTVVTSMTELRTLFEDRDLL